MKRVLILMLLVTLVAGAGVAPAMAKPARMTEEPAATVLEVPALPGWDVTGTWEAVANDGTTDYPQTMTLTMDALTGAVTGTGTDGVLSWTLEGQVIGSDITLERTGPDPYTASLTGTITATSMAGSWSDATLAGTWTATGTALPLAVPPVEGFWWLPPISKENKQIHVGANLPVKFRIGLQAADDVIEEPVEEPVEGEGDGADPALAEEPPVGEEPPVEAVPELVISSGEQTYAVPVKRCGDSKIWLGHFRPEAPGVYTAEVYLDGTLIGSISFTVAENGPQGQGNGLLKRAAGTEGETNGAGRGRTDPPGLANKNKVK